MPYPAGLTRFNITAALSGGEQMVHTLWVRKDSALSNDAPQLQSLTNKVRDEWAKVILGGAGVPPGIAAHLHTATEYTKVSGYSVNNLGRATAQAEATFAVGVKGSGVTALPPQCSLVTTLLTAQPGRSGRGRLYLGGLSASVLTNSGRMTFATAEAIADAMAGFYIRVRHEVAANDNVRPVVVSPTKTDSYKIKSVTVGDVIDTMRSRRNGLVENKTTEVVDAS